LSLGKRGLSLAAAGAAAVVVVGVFSTAPKTKVNAAGPTFAAIGCTNTNNATDIRFATTGSVPASTGGSTFLPVTGPASIIVPGSTGTTGTPGSGGVISSSNQLNFVSGSTPATFNVANPTAVILCGAVFQDGNVAGTAANTSSTPPTTGTLGGPFATDADPNTVDGGVITYTIGNGLSTSNPIVQILQSNSTSASINCGSATPPTTSTTGAVASTTPIASTTPAAMVTPAFTGADNPGTNGPPATPQTSTFNVVATGGTATITVPGPVPNSITVPFNASATTVMMMLNGLPNVITTLGGVVVSPASGTNLNTTPGVILNSINTGAAANLVFTRVSTGLTGAAIPGTPGNPGTPGSPAVTSLSSQGGLESCQGAVSNGDGTVSPSQGNTVQVALRPGVSFGLFGAGNSSVTIQATYNRFPALSAGSGPSSISTSTSVISFVTPNLSLSLTPNPAIIPANGGPNAASSTASTSASAAVPATGSTITASLFRNVPFASGVCVLTIAANGALTCSTGTIGAVGVAGSLQTLPGVEPGVVTFTTTSGVFTNGNVANGSQQVFSVHCGPVAGTVPFFQIPGSFGINSPSNPNSTSSVAAFASCVSATANLIGAGEAGSAVVTAQFVGDITGATASNATTVTFSISAATQPLFRGCNEVITPASIANNTPIATEVAAVSGTQVVSVWQFNNSLRAFQALFFSMAGAPVDRSTVGPLQSIFICVSSDGGTFNTGAF